MAWAQMKKTIYSLAPLRELLLAANRRYLEFISAIEDDNDGIRQAEQDLQPVTKTTAPTEASTSSTRKTKLLFQILARGEFNISGFQNKRPARRSCPDSTAGRSHAC